MARHAETGLETAVIEVDVPTNFEIDGRDIVVALDRNDERILGFILDLLDSADSSELRARLSGRLASWDEDREE